MGECLGSITIQPKIIQCPNSKMWIWEMHLYGNMLGEQTMIMRSDKVFIDGILANNDAKNFSNELLKKLPRLLERLRKQQEKRQDG